MQQNAGRKTLTKYFLVTGSIVLSIILLFALGVYIFFVLSYPLKYKNTILTESAEFGLKPAVVSSVINAESGFNPEAISGSGAVGLMQILPSTGEFIADSLGFDYFETQMLLIPETNIEFGCFYLRYLLNKFGDEETAFAAYNAGEGIVKQWLKDPAYSANGVKLHYIPFDETRNFVSRVLRGIEVYKQKF